MILTLNFWIINIFWKFPYGSSGPPYSSFVYDLKA